MHPEPLSASPSPRTLKLTLQYDGTAYVGWQRQPNGQSIQALVEDALAPIAGGRVTVHGAGRTDAGVHALGQVASVTLASSLPGATLVRALNATLPPAVRVLGVQDVPHDFHARFSARSKTYEYRIVNSAIVSPFLHRYVWHVPQPLDPGAMESAAADLVGRHDFAGFRGAGSETPTSTRTIFESAWRLGSADDPLVFRISGDGFLRHMVRAIVGTLVQIGTGRWEPDRIRRVLDTRDRALAGPTAPPQGLFLVGVDY